MELSQAYLPLWHSLEDILSFAYSLSKQSRVDFLMVFSALSWSVCLLRNKMCFQIFAGESVKSYVLRIINLVNLWVGHTNTDPVYVVSLAIY